MISFHSYWIPIVITLVCFGLPLTCCIAPEKIPFQRVAMVSFTLIGAAISVIAWLLWRTA